MKIASTDGHSLRTAVLQQAKVRPDAPAVLLGKRVLTYGELDNDARVLANALTKSGREPIERVGVFASRSRTAFVGTLGALCAGAAFVPLNRKFPVARTRAMIMRSELDAIIVDEDSASQLPAILQGLSLPRRILLPDTAGNAELSSLATEVIAADNLSALAPLRDLPPVLLPDLAYLLFTSGSTGEPKGVGVSQENVLHYIRSMSERYGISPSDRCSQTFDQTFDLSVHDIFLTWTAGACLVVPQTIELLAPVRFVQRHELTVWFSVPSVAALAVKKGMLRPNAMPSLRLSLFCGEPLPKHVAAQWQVSAPRSVVENLYGPTELTIACMVYRLPSAPYEERADSIVPIGKPLPGLGVCLVDENLAPVAEGDIGELLVCGPQTVPGYWHDESRTTDRFVELSVSPNRRYRFYRTGDRVQLGDDGNYIYVGRRDNQIKVLGHRVELGEIESVLLAVSGASQAVALGWPIEDGHALGVVAFVSGAGLPSESLISLAQQRLPSYMVPQRIIAIDEMPLNSNGKIDRLALQAALKTLQ